MMRCEISLMRARTGRLIRRLGPSLTSDGGPSDAYSLDWSPDGRQLLYSPMACCDLFADVHLYVERVDGTGRRQLTFARGQDVSGVWSPDGRRIAFVRIRAREGVGMLFSIWTIPVRGGRATRIWSLPVLDDPELEFGPYNTPRISWQPLPRRGSR